MKRKLKLGIAILVFFSALGSAQVPSSAESKSEPLATPNPGLSLAKKVPTARLGDIEITTDTQGVDFGPYLQKAIYDIKQNWYAIVPGIAQAPLFKSGKVVIEFAITKDGQIRGLHYVSSSGDVALDRAAYGGITATSPFAPLPGNFRGPYIGLRMIFSYNPDRDHNEIVTERLTSPNKNLIGLSPWHLQVPAGTSVQFATILNGITDQTKFPITWSVVGDCGAATCGNISESGMYTAPSTVPIHPLIFVKAKADAVHESYLAVVTIVPAEPPPNKGQYGGGAGLSQIVTKSTAASDPCASFRESSSGHPLALPEESGKSQSEVKVRISPQTNARVAPGYSLRLAATVSGATNTAVEWSVAGPGCSGPTCGSIEGGVYLAPSTAPAPPIVRLTATSKADSRASDSTTVCLVQPGGLFKWMAPPLSAAASISTAARQSALNSSEVVGSNDTADLKPYVEVLQKKVQENWYKHVPNSARGPELKQGYVTVEFLVERSGRVKDATIASTSGDKELDNAAVTAIHKVKLPPFPSTIQGDHLKLRFNFAYNPSQPL